MSPQVVGSPDYIKRSGLSGTQLFSQTIPNNVGFQSSVIDTNGFAALLVTTNNQAVSDTVRIQILWYEDSGALVSLGNTDWVPALGTTISIYVPVIARYFILQQVHLSGADGTLSTHYVYGTNLQIDDLRTQNTDQPMGHDNPSLGASAIQTTVLAGIFGGRVMVSVDQNANNKWTSWLEYYDYLAAAWVQFWTIHGPDHGQSYNSDAILPYAPCRINVRNDDTVAHVITWSVVAP